MKVIYRNSRILSININESKLSLKNWKGARPPQLTMGATPMIFIIAFSTICYIADHCGFELDEIRPIFSTLQLLHEKFTVYES